MCKLFIMTNTKKLKTEQVETLVKSVSKRMAKTERDGFGMSVRGSKGVFNRRFLKPKAASMTDSFSKLPFLKPSMNQDGELGTVDALIFHGRTSTNALGLVNTHPISKHGLHLCHNGVVEDSGPKYKMQSQNDTEHVVERFSQGMSEVEKHISGYYAFAAFKDGTDELFIAKDSIASLYFAEVPSLDCHVFATTHELITEALKSIGVKHLPIEDLKENTLLVYDGAHLMSQTDFVPKGRSTYADSLASKSLGYSLGEQVQWPEQKWNDDILSYDQYRVTPEEIFFEELYAEADHTWVFIKGKTTYSVDEFLELPEADILKATIIRADGTICSPDELRNGKLWEGQSA